MLSNSKLGFGLMRLPRNADGSFDLPQISRMVDEFLAAGFTYFDTAYVYEGSEVATRECLVKRHPRASYTIADKLPGWEIKCKEDMPRLFNESLTRLGVDYIDFYLLHALGRSILPVFDQFDAWSFLRELKAEGKIRYMGFSFHDSPDCLEEILTAHPDVDFIQLQINYLDMDKQNVWSRAILDVANKHGVPVVVMEPVKGGQLAMLPPREGALYHASYPESSQASFALRYASTREGVMTVLSGMSTFDQMRDNLKTFTNFVPMTEEDEKLAQAIVAGIDSYEVIPCTGCGYCKKGCPKNIQIPEIFRVDNHYTMYKDKEDGILRYKRFTENSSASSCIKCGKCEKMCPQHLKIREILDKIAEEFGY